MSKDADSKSSDKDASRALSRGLDQLTDLTETFESGLDDFEELLDGLESESKVLHETTENHARQIGELRSDIATLQESVDSLNAKLDEMLAYVRRVTTQGVD